MSRKSTQSMTVVPLTMRRLKLPADLPPGQQAMLQALIDSKPADFFARADLPLLVLLARHSERADLIEAEVQALEPGDLLGLRWLSPLAERETKAIVTILRTLRLTPQARYRPDNARLHAKSGSPRPWETAADDEDAGED
ncbi:MAG: hypothetical protein WA161_21370 [Pseudomonas sp.]|uniref:hypothetical protein n=1 Tax=Pseudomonas sp. TaxID=306 RepID=UPI003BB4DFF2